MRTLLLSLLLLPALAFAQKTHLRGSATEEYVDKEFTSKKVIRIISAIDEGCAVTVTKGEWGPSAWYFSDNITHLPERARLSIAPLEDISIEEVEAQTATMWVGLPVFINGQSHISYRCPAGKYITITVPDGIE